MMNDTGLRRVLPGQSSGSAHTFGTPRHPSIIDPILSKRVCFYKSGDPQFNGLRMVINNRTFKTFDALLDSLSKKVPLPFGVRNITTPHGVHAVSTLDDLEDGKSYICSDSRKVKPFNLARARKKLPPWYHARPVSSRRRTVQQARMFPSQSKKEPVVLRTPKRLLVFRNGDPSVKHTVVLSKRTTPTFESILEYISELIQFHVVKLLTSDGKRVEGLPGLILCSGTVVAAGREPFRPAKYTTEKSPAQTMPQTNRKSVRRLKFLNRKKKSPTNSSTSRPFSPSSERYIVNQIHNSVVERSSELRSNHSNSVGWESGHMLESVAETEGETCLGDGAESQGGLLPTDDDIEKSFRVNQDGSMTVEMKVRLTLKEEETIHWTTTLSRSSVANLLNENSLPPPPEEEQISSPTSLDLQSPAASIDSSNKDRTKDNNDDDPPTSCYGALRENSIEEENIKAQAGLASPQRASTPGHRQIRTKQTSIESVKSVTAEGIQEGVMGSYAYTEQTEHGAMTEQYCMVKQSSTRPVPKPRRLGSIETNCLSSRNVSTFKSAGIVESSGEEVTETVLHIYEQHTCSDNYLANVYAQGTTASGIPFCRPGSAETGLFTSNNESEADLWRPSTAAESINMWRAGSASLTSDLACPLPEANPLRKQPKSGKGKGKSRQTDSKNGKIMSPKPKLIKKRLHRLVTPKKRQKDSPSEGTEKSKKVKTFSSAGFLRKIYGSASKSKTPKKTKKTIKDKGITKKSSQQSDDTKTDVLKDHSIPSALDEIKAEAEAEKSRLDVAPKEITQPRGILTRQASMHQEKRNENESYDISKSMSLPAFNSSSAFNNEYVENWLEKAHFEPKTNTDGESIKAEKVVQKSNDLLTEAKETECQEDKSQVETSKTLQPEILRSSVKQRVQSFENKASPLPERHSINPQTVSVHQTPTHTESDNTSTTSPINKTSSDASSDMPVKISLQSATPSKTLSMDFPPPPSPPAESVEFSNTEYCEMDVSSQASSPLYRLSSVSSQMSDNQPLSISPSSEKAASPTELTMEKAPSVQSSVPPSLGEAPLPRNPSIKRAPLVSNLSFGRTMALRKACMDKYALSSDATSEITLADNVDNSAGTQQQEETLRGDTQLSNSMVDSKNSPYCCTSASPNSLTTEDREQSPSIASDDHPTPNDLQSKETKTQTEVPSPKPLVKKVQLLESPSQTKKRSPELSHKSPKLSPVRSHPPDKNMSPKAGKQRQASPSTERKDQKPKLQKTLSPYSQSLEVMSPPVRQRSGKKLLSRNHSSDDASESSHGSQRKTSMKRQNPQTQTGDLDKTESHNMPVPVEVNQSEVSKTNDLATSEEEKSRTQKMPQLLTTSNQPDITSVLEDICFSIKSIRLITQNKRPSCLERSNSLPDFSSHVASTFGSSSKALLAFLAVMTLKEGLNNQSVDELNANNVSCAEALKMIDSLKEIANIEDSHKLKDSLSELQESASKQLLQSWKGFQELSDKCRSRSPTPNELVAEACPERDCSIDEIMDNLNMPEKLKEELASLSVGFQSDEDKKEICARIEEEVEPSVTNPLIDSTVPIKDVSQDEKANVNVSSIIKRFTVIETSCTEETPKLKPREKSTKAAIHDQSNEAESLSLKPEVGQLESEKLQDNDRDKSSKDEVEDEGSSSKKQDSCTPEVEEQDMDDSRAQMQSQESVIVPENEPTCEEESGANRDLKASCDVAGSGSDAGDLSDEGAEVECENEQQERRGSDDSEEEYMQQNSSYVETGNKNALSRSDSKREQQSKAGYIGLSVSVDDTIGNSKEEDEAYSEEEVEHEDVKADSEGGLSNDEEEQESMLEEDYMDDLVDDMEKRETCKSLAGEREDKISVDDENRKVCNETGSPNTVGVMIESQGSVSLAKSSTFSADEDSGNDHSSCEEHVEVCQPKIQDDHTNSSNEEELSYFGKGSDCEEERATTYLKETPAFAIQSEEKCEKIVETSKNPNIETISQTVAERVIRLEKQVADSQKRTDTSPKRRFSQRNVPLDLDVEDSAKSQPTPGSRSAPQSSLSFSYDSGGVITTEPEGIRVRSIREMFLAKSATDIPQGHKPFQSPNSAEIAELRAQTSTSAGYQSQTSSEVSSGEDESPRKSISKGFVRRTIERLYGMRNSNYDDEQRERPPSVQQPSFYSPFHIAQSKGMPELSYFNSTSALDNFTEATRCLAFNAKVVPGHNLPVNGEPMLFSENSQIRKSVSDPVGINKSFTTPGGGMCKDTAENGSYPNSTKSEVEDKMQSFTRKCTYFALPHASDSEACQDDLSVVSKDGMNSESIVDLKDNSEDTKTPAEKNGTLPAIGVTDFKKMDNKVHPLVEPLSDGNVVVAQPGKGQGALNRRLQDPDMLDLLYDFCGQNCPIL